MYNLYIYEKQLLEKELKKNEEIKNNKLKEKRKNQMKKLFSNYCKRMDKFIFSLCNNPIIINDPLSPSDCRLFSKQNISNKSFNKSNNNYKNFIFGGFMTDRKRIELLNEKKQLIKMYEDKIIKSKNYKKNKEEKEKKENKNKIINQPRMRFKPRTELERVIEMMDLFWNKKKKYNYIMFEQMKKLDINKVKHFNEYGKLKKIYKNKNIKLLDIPKIESKDLEKDNMNKDSNSKKKEENNLLNINDSTNININEKKQKIKQKYNYNSKDILKLKNKILKELFKDEKKIYFKGASQYASCSDLINKNNSTLKKNKYKFNRTNSAINKFNNNINNLQNIKSKNNKKLFSYKNKIKKDSFSTNNDISNISLNDLGYNTKVNNIKKIINNKIKEEINNSIFFNNNNFKINIKENEENNLQEKLDYLKKIIEKRNDEKNEDISGDSKNLKIFKNKKKKNKINDGINNKKEVYNDGIKYNEKDLVKKVNIIFRKCNYYHPKSSHNKKSLIEGEGKLSFTSGLTINEFSNKYNLF